VRAVSVSEDKNQLVLGAVERALTGVRFDPNHEVLETVINLFPGAQ
jgi:hypothetical protein